AFVTDAFGGHGGIALYNRDLLRSLCNFPQTSQVVAFPRLMPNPSEPMPRKLVYRSEAIRGKLSYLSTALRALRGDRGYDLVLCGHINLMPIGGLASRYLRVPLVLFIYGIDAWKPTKSAIVNALARRAACVVSISDVTARNFRAWAREPQQRIAILPNA